MGKGNMDSINIQDRVFAFADTLKKDKMALEGIDGFHDWSVTNQQKPSGFTFAALAQKYIVYARVNKASSTVRKDRSRFVLLCRIFGDRSLTDIEAFDIEWYKQQRRSQVKPASVNRELALLKHMFHKAIDWGYLSHNPLKTVKLFKEPHGRIRYLTDDERERLLGECQHSKSSMLYPVVLTALYTGMRKGELQSLTWNDVDFNAKVPIITVRQTKTNEPRHIPISKHLMPSARTLRNRHPDSFYVFSKPDGSPYGNWRKAFSNACSRAYVEDFRFHDLRHTFASYLGMAGYNAFVIKALLGHKTLAMSARYTHIADSQLQMAVDRIGAKMIQLSLHL